MYCCDIYGAFGIYAPDGTTGRTTSICGNRYLFGARRFDAETGLYYYRARMYNRQIGRFCQTDPIGYADGINWYAYCANNPVMFVDPLGLCGESGTRWEQRVLQWQEADAEWQRLAAQGFYPVPRESLAPSNWELTTLALQDAGYGPKRAAFVAGLMNVTARRLWEGLAGVDVAQMRPVEGVERGAYVAMGGTEAVLKYIAVRAAFNTKTTKPDNRADLHMDLRSKGFEYKSTSGGGYVKYRGPNGETVWVKPTGEVIPVQGKGIRYDYNWNRLPDQSHSTGHFVEPLNQ